MPNGADGSLGLGGIGIIGAVANRYGNAPSGCNRWTTRVCASGVSRPEIVLVVPFAYAAAPTMEDVKNCDQNEDRAQGLPGLHPIWSAFSTDGETACRALWRPRTKSCATTTSCCSGGA